MEAGGGAEVSGHKCSQIFAQVFLLFTMASLFCSMWRTRPTRARPAPREMHALLQRCSSFWPPAPFPTPFPCHRAATNTPANAASIFILINYKMANVAESSTLMDCLVASLTQESLLCRGCGVVSIETRII